MVLEFQIEKDEFEVEGTSTGTGLVVRLNQ